MLQTRYAVEMRKKKDSAWILTGEFATLADVTYYNDEQGWHKARLTSEKEKDDAGA